MPTHAAATKVDPLPIFISYSHHDAKYLDRLKVYLKPFARNNEIDAWDDNRIQPGMLWKDEIKKALDSAKVAVLLVSPDFLASDFINDEELPPLLTAAKKKGVVFLYVVVGVVNLNRYPEIKQFQAVNDISHPLVKMEQYEQDDVWQKVADVIEDTFIKALAPAPQPNTPATVELRNRMKEMAVSTAKTGVKSGLKFIISTTIQEAIKGFQETPNPKESENGKNPKDEL